MHPHKSRRGRPPKKPGPRGRPRKVPSTSGRDYVGIAEAYQADVIRGRIAACQWIRLAVERQQRDVLRAQIDPACPFVWSDAHAREACAFLEHLPHVEGRWASHTIQLEPAQVFWVTCLFGWRQRAHLARRRFTVFYLEVGRKAAKSTLLAGVALFHMVREHEPGAQVICGATTGSQARIVFGIAQQMIRQSLWLRKQGLEAFANRIITTTALMRPVNAKASTQDGLNPSCIILDESHAQKFGLHDVLKSAQGARLNPLLLCPTTAGYDLLSVGYALRTTVTKMLQQVYTTDHLLGFVYTLDDGDDWRDPKVWIKANPLIGVTPTRDWIAQYCQDAQQTPGIEGEFRVKCCSLWAQAAHAWLSITAWDRCADPTLTLEQFHGARCWIGADLAQLDDLAAVAWCFEHGDAIAALVRFYLPRDVVATRARAVPEYEQWVQAGLLRLTEGTMIDYAQIEADIRASCLRFAVQALRFDQYGSAQIVSALAASGYPAAILDKSAKNVTPAARELESRVTHGRFAHDGNSCLRWMASNAVVSRRVDDSLMPKKDNADSPNKIDGIDAIIQAMSAMLTPAAVPDFQILVL